MLFYTSLFIPQMYFINLFMCLLGDLCEAKAISNVFKSRSTPIMVSSTKGATGHLLGAAGIIEAIFSILAIQDVSIID